MTDANPSTQQLHPVTWFAVLERARVDRDYELAAEALRELRGSASTCDIDRVRNQPKFNHASERASDRAGERGPPAAERKKVNSE